MSSVDPRLARPSQGNAILTAARENRIIRKFIDDLVPGAAQVVLTQQSVTYNLSPRQVVYITQLRFGISTVNDDCHFEIGYTDQPDGAGTFTDPIAHRHVVTGGAIAGYTDHPDELVPPVRVAYKDGARCITYRVDANDAGCVITVEWAGYWERE